MINPSPTISERDELEWSEEDLQAVGLGLDNLGQHNFMLSQSLTATNHEGEERTTRRSISEQALLNRRFQLSVHNFAVP